MQNDNREFFTSLKELVDHLYSGGKVGYVNNYGGYNFIDLSNGKFMSANSEKSSDITVAYILSTKQPENHWKYKEEPKYITWAEVPEYLEKGYKLRPEGMASDRYIAESQTGYWLEYSTSQSLHPLHITQHRTKCKWEVVE